MRAPNGSGPKVKERGPRGGMSGPETMGCERGVGAPMVLEWGNSGVRVCPGVRPGGKRVSA